jgi:hypothetical protein
LGLSIPVNKRLTLTAYHTATADPSVSINRDLLRVFAEGNASFLGKTVAFGSSGTGSMRSEFGVGAAFHLKNFTVGARMKLLYGIAGVFTQNTPKADVTFNADDYAMRFQTNFDVLAFQGAAVKDYDGIGSLLNNGLTSKNTGFGLDLGATFKLGKLHLAASALDLGSAINWQNGGTRYQSDGTYTYRGINLSSTNQFFNWNNIGSDSYVDTLKKVIGLTETTEGVTYRQTLPVRAFLSGTYELNDHLRVGALLAYEGETLATKNQVGFALNASTKLLKIIDLGATVGLRNGTVSNIGGHIAAKLSIFQIFAVTDNVLTTFNPYGSKNANGRVGINLVF